MYSNTEEKLLEPQVEPWEQTELTAVLRLRYLRTPEAKERILDEIVTDGSELLDAPMITRRQLFIEDGKVVTAEGEKLRDMWKRCEQAQKKRAMKDGRFWMEYWRNCRESNEQIAFEEEVLPSFINNTQITFSLYAQDQEDRYGTDFIDDHTHYKRDRKFGLMRILYQLSPNKVEIVSISIENSNQLAAMQKVAEALDHPIQYGASATEVLGHNIQTFVRPEDRLAFERELVGIYDNELGNLLGGEFQQGRAKEKLGIESYSFVMANQDLLAVYLHEIEKISADASLVGEDLLKAVRVVRRSYMASLYERHEAHDYRQVFMVRSADNIDYDLVYRQMLEAGLRVAEKGIRLIGCGTAIEALQNMTDDEFKQLLTTKEEKYEFDKEMHCLVCQPRPKKDEPKKMCGPCGICRSCDAKLRVKTKAS